MVILFLSYIAACVIVFLLPKAAVAQLVSGNYALVLLTLTNISLKGIIIERAKISFLVGEEYQE